MKDDFDFTILTEKDKKDISYSACIGGSMLVGVAIGRFAGIHGVLAGALAGLALGVANCKYLKGAEVIKYKLFSSNEKLSDQELKWVLQAIKFETEVKSKSDAMYLLSLLRNNKIANGMQHPIDGSENSYTPLKAAAKVLLNQRLG